MAQVEKTEEAAVQEAAVQVAAAPVEKTEVAPDQAERMADLEADQAQAVMDQVQVVMDRALVQEMAQAQVMAQITVPAAAMAVAVQDHLQDAEMNGLTDSGMTETETLPTLIRDHGRVILPDGGSRMRADGILSPNGRR